ATRIRENIRYEYHSLILENSIRSRCRWAIRQLGDDLCFDSADVAKRDRVLERRRQKDVAIDAEDVIRIDLLRATQSSQRTGCSFVFQCFSDVDTRARINRRFRVARRDDLRAILRHESSDICARVSEAVHRHTRTFQAHPFHTTSLTQRIETTARGRFSTSLRAAE